MNVDELVDVLRLLGLSEYESKAYSALLLKGHSKASHISKEAEVPQSKIYEVLEKLAEKRLVEVYDVRPKEFKPISPNAMLTAMIQEKEAEINQIKSKVSSMLKMLNSFQESVEGVWTSKEKSLEDFFKRASEMYDRADAYIYAMTKNFSWPSRLADAARACVRRGIEVKVVCTGIVSESSYYRAKWLADNGIEIRLARAKLQPSLIDLDCREVLIRLDATSTKKEKFMYTTIYTRDVSLVKVIDTYVKSIWKKSRPLNFG